MTETSQLADYPDYSGEEPTCPKCQRDGASTEYMPVGRCMHAGRWSQVIGLTANERLHRQCLTCGYSWDEAVRS